MFSSATQRVKQYYRLKRPQTQATTKATPKKTPRNYLRDQDVQGIERRTHRPHNKTTGDQHPAIVNVCFAIYEEGSMPFLEKYLAFRMLRKHVALLSLLPDLVYHMCFKEKRTTCISPRWIRTVINGKWVMSFSPRSICIISLPFIRKYNHPFPLFTHIEICYIVLQVEIEYLFLVILNTLILKTKCNCSIK